MSDSDDMSDPNAAIRDLLRAARGERQGGSPEEPPTVLSPEPTGATGTTESGRSGASAPPPRIDRDPGHGSADLSHELRATLSWRRGGGRV